LAIFSINLFLFLGNVCIFVGKKTAATKQPFNETQLFVLRTFASVKSAKDRDALTSLCLDFFQKKLDEVTDKWWEEVITASPISINRNKS
jgi:hypothetical protein